MVQKPRKIPSGKYRVDVKYRGMRASNSFWTAEAAKEWARWAEDEMRAGRDPNEVLAEAAEPIKVREWIERWRELRDVGVSQAAKVDSLIRTHIVPAFGDKAVDEIAWEDVKLWVKGLRARDDLENSTVVTIYGAMSGLMTDAVHAKIISESPCHHVKASDGVRRQKAHLDERQALEMAERCVRRRGRRENHTYRLMTVAAAYTGMRWGELGGMRRDHRNKAGDLTVDLKRKRIIVGEDTVLHEVGGYLWMEDPKSTAGGRIVSLPHFLVDLLDEHLDTHDHEHVFCNGAGGWVRRSNFGRDVWRPQMAKLMPDRPARQRPTFHSLRDTHVSMLLADDVPDRAIDIRVGHAVPGAAGRYAKIHRDLDRRICDSLQARYERTSEITCAPGAPGDVHA